MCWFIRGRCFTSAVGLQLRCVNTDIWWPTAIPQEVVCFSSRSLMILFLPLLFLLLFFLSCLLICLSETRKMMTSPISSVAPPPSAVALPLGNQGRPRNPVQLFPGRMKGWNRLRPPPYPLPRLSSVFCQLVARLRENLPQSAGTAAKTGKLLLLGEKDEAGFATLCCRSSFFTFQTAG